MVLAKSKNAVGLGNSLMNDRFGKAKGSDRKKLTASTIQRINHATGETYVTNERQKASWVKMRSVTEQPALDEFLSTAELAGTDFIAQKSNNIKIIHTNEKNPYLLSGFEEQEVVGKQEKFKSCLTVPRRPIWKSTTTPEQLDLMERNSFLEWRRGLAEVQQENNLLMTPFERNIEVWRQLWRVIERSDLVVQIVDARNPLLFRSEDLEQYVKDVNSKKNNLLLVNKADLLTVKQRQIWANYFNTAEIPYTFFSASLAKEINEANLNNSEETNLTRVRGSEQNKEVDEIFESEGTHIVDVNELEALFLRHANLNSSEVSAKINIGLVGYPNVGKSSTINALIGAKKVSVSSTPGKTKHFQTIHLSDKVILCDCPGLVFPNFAKTKAELVCNGILPIDQLREFTGPVGLVAQRIPKLFLECLYGIKIKTKPLEEGGTGIPTAEEVLIAYAKSRGFTRSGHGQPDESRAARYILKDYVNGKILFCHPPPETDSKEFNLDYFKIDKQLSQEISALGERPSKPIVDISQETKSQLLPENGIKSQKLDSSFFVNTQKNAAHLRMPFNYKYSEQGKTDEKHLPQYYNSKIPGLLKDLNIDDAMVLRSKKHFKSGKKGNSKRRLKFFED
ncbi:Large subunit GTPase 1 [Erysiphe necator]|nr:Large subunit GTPase 1 [Erysiphe necator]